MDQALLLDVGRMPYEPALFLQRQLHEARCANAIPDVLMSVEHDSVVTRGTRTEDAEVALAAARGVPVVETERGGKATWHGPGQAVVYPIFDLRQHGKDIKALVCRLEEAVIGTLAANGIAARRRPGYPGVWTGTDGQLRKIASLGLRVRDWVSFHGLALNVCNDLEPFTWFTPCGIPDVQMTSMQYELESDVELSVIQRELITAIADQFDLHVTDTVTPADIAGRLAVPA